MASRSASKALRSSFTKQLTSPTVQRRTFVSAFNAATRPLNAAAVTKPAFAGAVQQVRGMKTIDFAGHKETVFGKIALPLSTTCLRC